MKRYNIEHSWVDTSNADNIVSAINENQEIANARGQGATVEIGEDKAIKMVKERIFEFNSDTDVIKKHIFIILVLSIY